MASGFNHWREVARKFPYGGRQVNKNVANILKVGKLLDTFTAQDVYDYLKIGDASEYEKSFRVKCPITRMIGTRAIVRISKGVYRLQGKV